MIRQTKLHFKQGNSDKVYELDLCEAGEGEFLVNFRYGRRGASLREGTKTAFPVSRSKAEGIFESLVTEKTKKGYKIIEGTGIAAEPSASVVAPTSSSDDPRRTAVVKRLADEAAGQRSGKPGWKLSRVIWRAGAWAMKETADSIAAVVPSLTTEMEFWCAAWALGRCGEAKHAVALDVIADRARSVPWVMAMVTEAKSTLAPEESLQLAFEGALGDALNSGDAKVFRALAEQELRAGRMDEAGQRSLMLLAGSIEWVREVVYDLVRCLPIQRGTMVFFRQVLKSSEFRLDAELYGQVVHRIEMTRGAPIQYYRPKGTPRPAFTTVTRTYLRRRVLRHLRIMGESGDPALFIPLATGLLVSFDDEVDKPLERSSVSYDWDPGTNRYTSRTLWHPRYSTCLGFLWLMRGAGSSMELNRRKTGWRFLPEMRGEPSLREEPFPELWDQAPDAIMHLLRHARSAEVQQFAIRVWQANPDFVEEADGALIGDLLACWFPATVQLGLEIARAKWDAANPDLKLLLAMLDSPLGEARAQGADWLAEAATKLATDSDFLSGLAFVRHEEGRVAVKQLLRASPLDQKVREEVVARVVSGMLALDDADLAGVASDWLEVIAPGEVAALPESHLLSLAAHPLEACQLLAVRVLLERGSPAGLPEALLMSALSSEHGSVRRLGMELVGKLQDHELAQRVETLAACAVSRHEELRTAAAPLLARAAAHDRQAARDLVLQWYPLLFRQESFEGLHASVYEALSTSFEGELDAIPEEAYVKMLESKYGHGQMLGFLILKREVSVPDIDDLIDWAVHPLAALREWARERLDREALCGDPSRVLKLLEGPYDDSREWAFDFCRNELKDGDWSPEALVAVCDSINPMVRDFGRELVTRLFREEDGPLYLARLSQHPSVEVQQFATNYLERFAAGHPGRIAGLDLYFRTVLSKIGAGRVAKRRVLAFLEEQAMGSEEVAKQVNALLGRQAGTVAIQDKAEMIRILDTVRRTWPGLESPLQAGITEVHQPS